MVQVCLGNKAYEMFTVNYHVLVHVVTREDKGREVSLYPLQTGTTATHTHSLVNRPIRSTLGVTDTIATHMLIG